MSKKILIDSDVLDQALKALGVGLIMSEPYSKEDTFSTSIFSDSIAKISTAIKEAEGKPFSVLEWHSMAKPIDTKDAVLTRRTLKMPMTTGHIYSLTTREDTYLAEEWAYLPE